MSPRDDIFAKVRRAALQGAATPAVRRAAVEARLASPPRHIVPKRTAGKSGSELTALLRHYLSGQSATVLDVSVNEDVPTAIAAYLAAEQPIRIAMGTDPVLTALPWSGAPSVVLTTAPAKGSDTIGFSRAVAGIAETGTLMLLSGPENPVTLTFLPPTHIVLLSVADVVASHEDALVALRRLTGGKRLPRTVNLVSGPSRTADIGGKLVLGAHGPRRLIVMLVGAAADKAAV
jgi:L-lactate dehydrogenase complex protein LldG